MTAGEVVVLVLIAAALGALTAKLRDEGRREKLAVAVERTGCRGFFGPFTGCALVSVHVVWLLTMPLLWLLPALALDPFVRDEDSLALAGVAIMSFVIQVVAVIPAWGWAFHRYNKLESGSAHRQRDATRDGVVIGGSLVLLSLGFILVLWMLDSGG